MGADFIGVEVSVELNKRGYNVPCWRLRNRYSTGHSTPEFGKIAEENLAERGVNVVTGKGIAEIQGKDGNVEGVVLSIGEKLSQML